MSPTAVPSRITIDFRDAVHPSRMWILGLGDTDERVDLLTFELPPAPSLDSTAWPVSGRGVPSALSAPCACPDFCERDHVNE
jgi:hypothetical protein